MSRQNRAGRPRPGQPPFSCIAFARDSGSNCGVLLDSWHWHHAGANPEDIIKAGREAIVHVQVNDAAREAPEQVRDNERLLPGEGVIDLTGFFHALKEIGYQDGLNDGAYDLRSGHSYRPKHGDNYKHADRGYIPTYGNKNYYKEAYREAYMNGYQQGFNSQVYQRR